ncbi:MAG: hypothetical protein U0797_18670 [Gemmataceae bacterium]
MFETLFQSNPALFIPVVSIVGTAIVFTVWLIAHYYSSTRRQEIEATLKQDMLNRGMTAADIERVMLASGSRDSTVEMQAKETISDNEYYLVEKMLDDGHAIEDVERVIRAFKEGKEGSVPVRPPQQRVNG